MNQDRLKKILQNWETVLITETHLNVFLKDNTKFSEEEKTAFANLWLEAKGFDDVKEKSNKKKRKDPEPSMQDTLDEATEESFDTED